MNFLMRAIVICGLVAGLPAQGFAAPGAPGAIASTDEASKTATAQPPKSDEIQGEISEIGKDYISIIYQRDTEKGIEYEMLFPVDESAKFEHRNSLKEFGVGDTVRIQFEDTAEEKAGAEQLKRKVKVINFVSPAPKKPPVAAEPGNEDPGAE